MGDGEWEVEPGDGGDQQDRGLSRWHELRRRLAARIPTWAEIWLATKSTGAFVGKNYKGLLVVATIVAVFIPGVYGSFVWWLPKADYQIGTLGNPPNFDSLPGWDIDLTWIDGAPLDQQLQRVLTATGTVARMGKDSYKPGRIAPSGTAQEAWGKQWNGSQCLFISSVKLVVIKVWRKTDIANKGPTRTYYSLFEARPGDDTSYVSVSADRVRRDAGVGDLAQYYLSRLPASVKDAACLKSDAKNGPGCSRIAIWAHGTPAPCAVSLF